jgi:hypothetical protein
MKKHILSLAFLGLMGTSQVMAQVKPTSSFIAVACDQPIGQIYYKIEGKEIPLKLPAYEPVGPLACDSGGILNFYKKVNPAIPAPGPGKVVAKVDLPANSAVNILLFNRVANGEYAIRLFACDADSFPLGQVRFVNLSAKVAAFKVNEQVITLQSNETKIVPPNGNLIKYAVAVPAASGWAESINGFLRVDPKNRITFFITDSQSASFKVEAAEGIYLEKTKVNCFQVRH